MTSRWRDGILGRPPDGQHDVNAGWLLRQGVRAWPAGTLFRAVDFTRLMLDRESPEQLAGAGRRTRKLEALTDRERDVLALMVEGRTNTAIAQQLHVSAGTVEKHVAAIFGDLDLPVSEDHNRRVLAAIRMLHQDRGDEPLPVGAPFCRLPSRATARRSVPGCLQSGCRVVGGHGLQRCRDLVGRGYLPRSAD